MALLLFCASLYPQITIHYRYWKKFGRVPVEGAPAGLEALHQGILPLQTADPGSGAGDWVGLGGLEMRLRLEEVETAWFIPASRLAIVIFRDGSAMNVSPAEPMPRTILARHRPFVRWCMEMYYPFDAAGSDETYFAWVYGATPADHRWSMPFWQVGRLQTALELKLMELADADGYRLLDGPDLRGFWFREARTDMPLSGAERGRFFAAADRTWEVTLSPGRGADRFPVARARALMLSARVRPGPAQGQLAGLHDRATAAVRAKKLPEAMLLMASAAGSSADVTAEWTMTLGEICADARAIDPESFSNRAEDARKLVESLPPGARRDALLARLRSK